METLSIQTNATTTALMRDAARPYLVVLTRTAPSSWTPSIKVMGRYATRKDAAAAHRRLSIKLGFVDFRAVLG